VLSFEPGLTIAEVNRGIAALKHSMAQEIEHADISTPLPRHSVPAIGRGYGFDWPTVFPKKAEKGSYQAHARGNRRTTR
jgi:hypothetical protein